MIAFLLLILLVVLVLAVVNHYFFPIPPFAWGILALIVVVVLFVLAFGAVDGGSIDLGDGRR